MPWKGDKSTVSLQVVRLEEGILAAWHNAQVAPTVLYSDDITATAGCIAMQFASIA